VAAGGVESRGMMQETKQIDAVVTTSRKWDNATLALAQTTAARLGIPYAERRTLSLAELRARYGVTHILVAKNGLLMLETPGGELFFHPNMAHLRIKNIRHGQGDRMGEAMQLRAGMRVLDCTLGFGADAITAAYLVGETGQVTGLESQPLVEAVVGWGLAHFVADSQHVLTAMRRVQTVCTDALTYLRTQPDRAYDVVYFDPMFRHPFYASKALDPLRTVADPRPLTAETVAEACRVARQRVVLKETAKSGEFARLGFTQVTGGKYSKVHYGVLEL